MLINILAWGGDSHQLCRASWDNAGRQWTFSDFCVSQNGTLQMKTGPVGFSRFRWQWSEDLCRSYSLGNVKTEHHWEVPIKWDLYINLSGTKDTLIIFKLKESASVANNGKNINKSGGFDKCNTIINCKQSSFWS